MDYKDQFEKWWDSTGQFHRAGGGNYEKTFAYHAFLFGIELVLKDVAQQSLDDTP